MAKGLFGVLVACIFFLGSCTSLKQLGFTGFKSNAEPEKPAAVQNSQADNAAGEIKFLDDISASLQPVQVEVPSLNVNYPNIAGPAAGILQDKLMVERPASSFEEKNAETFSALQNKYAAILGVDAWYISNVALFEFIDDWYGTRYCMGGTTKKCIDCSAIVQILFADIYNIAMPRTAREQYKAVKRISLTELQEGDLLFFNTRGRGISHVGVYLANNKFFHSATSSGVMISDMYEPYFIKRLAGAGRVVK